MDFEGMIDELLASHTRATSYAAANGFGHSLCGMCAIAAADLWNALVARGFNAKIALYDTNTSRHCFVLCNGFILDPTAQQFGFQGPELRPEDKKLINQWYANKFFESVSEFRKHLKKTRWPSDQIPKRK